MNKGATGTATPAEWFADRGRASEVQSTRIFDVGDLLNILRSSRRLIAMTVATTTVLALAAGILMPKRYSASTQLFIDSRGIKVLANDVSPQAAVETAIADFESQVKILASGTVMLRVAEREKLGSDPTFIPQPGLMSRLRALLPGPKETIEDRTRLAAAILEKSVTIRRADRSFVVDVVVSDPDAARAARLSQAVAEVYLEGQLNNRRDLARRLGGEVSGRLQDLRERVEAAERRLNDFKTANNLVYSSGGLVAEQDLTELNNQLNQARARTARAKARLDQLTRLSGNTGTAATAEVLDSPTIVQLRVRLAEANRQAAELRRNLGPLHPEIQTADARVREANSAIAGEVERRRSSVRNDYEQSLAAERVLAQQINELKTKSTDTSQALIGLRELERAVEANKKVYEEFLLRSRELSEQQSIFANASYIITPASVPSQPSGLTLPLLLAIGFFAGFPLGGGLAIARAQLAEIGQKRPARASPARPTSSGVPVIARIARREFDSYLQRGALSRVAVPSDAIVEFAQAIEDAMPAGEGVALLIAGANSDSASAQTAAALACAWSYDGYDTLLIDGDGQTTRISKLAAMQDMPGLYDRLHRNVAEFVRWGRSGLPHILPLMPPGQRRDISGARRIVGHRLEDVAESVENIVIDAGDFINNEFAAVLARAASAAIVVGDDESSAVRVTEQLRREGVPVLGIVSVIPNAPERAAAAQEEQQTGSRLSFFNRWRNPLKRSDPADAAVKSA